MLSTMLIAAAHATTATAPAAVAMTRTGNVTTVRTWPATHAYSSALGTTASGRRATRVSAMRKRFATRATTVSGSMTGTLAVVRRRFHSTISVISPTTGA